MDMLSDLYFGKVCPSEQSDATDESCELEKILKGIDPKFREQIDEYISNENLKASKQEAMAFAKGCSFAVRFMIECLSK